MDSDLRDFILTLHRENKDNFADNNSAIIRLTSTVSSGFEAVRLRAEKIATDLTAHEKADLVMQLDIKNRLNNLEGIFKNVKWFLRAAIVAFITFIFDLVIHLTHHL